MEEEQRRIAETAAEGASESAREPRRIASALPGRPRLYYVRTRGLKARKIVAELRLYVLPARERLRVRESREGVWQVRVHDAPYKQGQ